MKLETRKLLIDLILKRTSIEISEDTLIGSTLFGTGALIDSLDFINFILDVETQLKQQTNMSFNLRKLIMEHGLEVIRTFESFEDFLNRIIADEK